MTYLSKLSEWLGRAYAGALAQLDAGISRQSATAFWGIRGDVDSAVGFLLDQDLGTWFRFVPLSDPATTSSRVQAEVMTALGDGSQLLWKAGITDSEAADENGAWKIALIFIADVRCKSAWESAIQTLRAKSGFTEEIAIDVIFVRDEDELGVKLQAGDAIPHLMLHTRKLLALPLDQLQTWASADSKVEAMIRELPSQFSEAKDRELVVDLVGRILRDYVAPGSNAVQSPRRYDRLEIRTTRNISDFDLALRHRSHPVLARIIYGPNGTGKSGIFEALSLAVASTSRRLDVYLSDKDEGRTINGASYVTRVLTALDGGEAPSITLDGDAALRNLPKDLAESRERLASADGTLLAQEDARRFVEMSGAELGARVLTGYSTLARSLQRVCEDEYRTANTQRQNWLRTFGINVAVKRADSRLINLVQHFLQAQFPPGSQQIGSWLAAVETRIPAKVVEARRLAAAWGDIDGRAKRDSVAQSVVPLDSLGARSDCVRLIGAWVERRQSVIASINLLLKEISSATSDLAQHRGEIDTDLKAWQRWLNRPDPPIAPSAEIVEGAEQKLAAKLAELKGEGTALGEHLQHLKHVKDAFLPTWISRHPDDCPTCGVKHSEQGGIAEVVTRLERDVSSKIEKAREDYAALLAQARAAAARREERGECPLSEDRRIELAALLMTDDSGYESLQDQLKQQRGEQIVRSIDALLNPPPLPPPEDSATAGERLWSLVEKEEARGIALWDLPDRWARIQESVNKQCSAIVEQHLPSTLQAVWTELAMVLTPARWNLSGNPSMATDSKSQDSLRIIVGGDGRSVGVKHIFNQAENHVLGLAWFFTRYLSSGRSKHQLIALDDPAQEMDQTTFRAFTRFVQTLCRLHERLSLPLTFVLLLHQEDRALDAARATNHQLTALRWARTISTRDSVEHLILMTEEFRAPLPRDLAGLPSPVVSSA
jgi:hypothetical protein